MICPSDGDVKPGGPLGAFREEHGMSRHQHYPRNNFPSTKMGPWPNNDQSFTPHSALDVVHYDSRVQRRSTWCAHRFYPTNKYDYTLTTTVK